MNGIEHYLARSAFMKARMGVYENMHALLSEVSSRPTETFAQLFKRWAERDRKRKLDTWRAYQHIAVRLESGMNLATAMLPYIPPGEAMILRSGEEAGKLPDVLASIVSQSEVLEQIRTEMTGALMEPAIMLVGFMGLSLMFGMTLWPMFDKVIDPSYWDTWVLPLKYFHVWYAKTWWWSTLVLVVLIVIIMRSRPTWTGSARRIADHLPPWNVYKDLQGIQTLVVLGALTNSGLTLDAALDRMMKGSPQYLRWHLMQMHRRNRAANANIVTTFSTGLFSNYIIDRVADAAQSKDLNEVMIYVAGTSLRAISRAMVLRAKALNMAGILLIAVLFSYMAAVQTIGVQDAVGRFEQKMSGAR